MFRKYLIGVIILIISSSVLLTGCGGSGSTAGNPNIENGDKTVTLAVTVPIDSIQKKSKNAKNISVTKVKGVLLSDDTEVEGTEEGNGKFVVKVPKGSDVHLVATVTNDIGSELNLESFVNDATDSEQTVDEDSTRVAALVVNESNSQLITVQELLKDNHDLIKEIKEILKSYENRDTLNELIESADSQEDLEEIKTRIEATIDKLKDYRRLLALIEKRLEQFENGSEPVKFGVLTGFDIENNDSDENENDDDFINELVVRHHGVKDLANGNESAENSVDVSLNEDGSLSVERGDEIISTRELSSHGRISGRFVSGRVDGLTISIKRSHQRTNVDFSFSADATKLVNLVKLFEVDEKIALKYKEVDGKKIVKCIFGEGVIKGTLTAISKESVTITKADSTIVILPLKKHIKNGGKGGCDCDDLDDDDDDDDDGEIDTTAPTITSITSSIPDGVFGIGSQIPITINFSEEITLIGTMAINLDSGGVVIIEAFTGTTATGVYTVRAGQNSLDLVATSIVVHISARDAALNDLDLTLPLINIGNTKKSKGDHIENENDIDEVKNEEGHNDVSVLEDVEDNQEYQVANKNLTIGDTVVVHWKIVNNVMVASGVFSNIRKATENSENQHRGNNNTDRNQDHDEVLGDRPGDK